MFISCEGRVADTPYEMPFLGHRVYSLEELCYVIYNNIYSINAEFFQLSLAKWLRHETDHHELADKLENLRTYHCIRKRK